jgi:hypothetical protein
MPDLSTIKHYPGFTSLEFAIFVTRKVVSLASKPQPGGLGLFICITVAGWSSYSPRHMDPFSSNKTNSVAFSPQANYTD